MIKENWISRVRPVYLYVNGLTLKSARFQFNREVDGKEKERRKKKGTCEQNRKYFFWICHKR